jgi:hypothetical protein
MNDNSLYCMTCKVIVPIEHVTEAMTHDFCHEKVYTVKQIHDASVDLIYKEALSCRNNLGR